MKSVSWSCPSNIAIVKYWGKYGRQMPRNTSISFTLSNAFSTTKLTYKPKSGQIGQVKFFLDGVEKPGFIPKIEFFFKGITPEMPFIADYDFQIDSHNTFPHSSGIASSASGMGALAMCLCDIESGFKENENIDIQRASKIARLGSGSACRSVFPVMALWGKHMAYEHSDDEYAIGVGEGIHEIFKSYHDDILIVSDQEKSVSSTAGHALMDSNVFAATRYIQANDHITTLKAILAAGDADAFGKLAETEALTLHALMMCSEPSYMLMQPATVSVIQHLRAFRADTQIPIYFTLDAGPNVHILYPEEVTVKAKSFINEVLRPLAHGGLLIEDHVGQGPKKELK